LVLGELERDAGYVKYKGVYPRPPKNTSQFNWRRLVPVKIENKLCVYKKKAMKNQGDCENALSVEGCKKLHITDGEYMLISVSLIYMMIWTTLLSWMTWIMATKK
jgi:hypothetical protein